jgi:hypothetical protein
MTRVKAHEHRRERFFPGPLIGRFNNWKQGGSSEMISVDTDSQVQGVAQEFLGNDDRLTLVLDDGLRFLRQQEPENYDFVFADAIPGKYDGLEDCLRVVKVGFLRDRRHAAASQLARWSR